jgi:capsular polysaccharide biosynthesis protein
MKYAIYFIKPNNNLPFSNTFKQIVESASIFDALATAMNLQCTDPKLKGSEIVRINRTMTPQETEAHIHRQKYAKNKGGES